MPYSYSFDEETFSGSFDTREEAATEAFAEDEWREACYVGKNVTPTPEDYIDADDLIENIQCQDAFAGEWAEGWPGDSKEQREELTAALRKTLAEWLDKHSLRPTFFNVEDVKKVEKPQPSI